MKNILGDWKTCRTLICGGTLALAAATAGERPAYADLAYGYIGSPIYSGQDPTLPGGNVTGTATFNIPSGFTGIASPTSYSISAGGFNLSAPTGPASTGIAEAAFTNGNISQWLFSLAPSLSLPTYPFPQIFTINNRGAFTGFIGAADGLFSATGLCSGSLGGCQNSFFNTPGTWTLGGQPLPTSPPFPTSDLNPNTPPPPQTGSNGTITVNATGIIDVSGNLNGSPATQTIFAQRQGNNQGGAGAFTVLDALGTKNSISITESSKVVLNGPSIVNGSTSGTDPVFSVGLIKGFNLGASGLGNISDAYSTFRSSCPTGCSTGAFNTPDYTLQTSQQTQSGTSNLTNGGAIQLTATPTVTSGTGTLNGTYSLTGTVTSAINYTPFSASQYFQNALAGTSPTDTDANRVATAVNSITGLRATSADTAQFNIPLMRAEYAGEGFVGGRTLAGLGATNQPTWFNDILATGPVALTGWRIVGPFDTLIAGNLPGISSPEGLKAGYEADFQGLVAGATGVSPDQFAANLDGAAPISPGTGSPTDPYRTAFEMASNSLLNSWFNFDYEGGVVRLDPVLTKNMQYAFTNYLATLTLPNMAGGLWDLRFNGLEYDNLGPGQTFSFLGYDKTDYVDLFYRGLDSNLGLDFTIDFSFLNNGRMLGDVASSNTLAIVDPGDGGNPSAVFEPSSLALLAAALTGAGAAAAFKGRSGQRNLPPPEQSDPNLPANRARRSRTPAPAAV